MLGSLLEKQVTVPDILPAVAERAAHRVQPDAAAATPSRTTTSRPSRQTGRRLKDRGLLRIVWSDTGRRTLKYHQTLDETLGLGPRRAGPGHRAAAARPAGTRRAEDPHRSAAPVRGPGRRRGVPRADGRARAGAELPRQPGQHDNRGGCTCLGDVPTAPARSRRRPHVDREKVLAGGAEARDDAGPVVVRRGGDRVRRPHGRRAGRRLPVRDLAPGPGRGPRRRRSGRRGRLRARPRHGVPRRRGCRRDRDRPVAGAWSPRPGAGSPTAPTRSATCAG